MNRVTGELEPRLAISWTSSSDNLTWTLSLRPDVRFSDGTPFTASDVLFTFEALYDEGVGSSLGFEARIGDKPLRLTAVDDHHLTVTFSKPHGPGLSIIASVPILPRHKLEAALKGHTFRSAWSIGASPSDVVGLGPFMLANYTPGQNLIFKRNPYFWLSDSNGQRLPYLDEVEVHIVPNQGAELTQLLAGTTHLMSDAVRAEDITILRTAESAGRIRLVNVGTSLDVSTFWFNVRPNSERHTRRPWLSEGAFRRALSHAIDRQAIVDSLHLGAAKVVFGPITPGHKEWHAPELGETKFDRAQALAILATIGITDRNADGLLEDQALRPMNFSLLTQAGNTERERTCEIIKEQLRQLGITVDVVALPPGSLQQRFSAGDFDAMYYGVRTDSADPANNLGFWLSSGPFHFWWPNQATPATQWEAEIDRLIQLQATTVEPAERRVLFKSAQTVLAENAPALWFAAADVVVAMNPSVGGVTPSVTVPNVLWNVEHIFLRPPGK